MIPLLLLGMMLLLCGIDAGYTNHDNHKFASDYINHVDMSFTRQISNSDNHTTLENSQEQLAKATQFVIDTALFEQSIMKQVEDEVVRIRILKVAMQNAITKANDYEMQALSAAALQPTSTDPSTAPTSVPSTSTQKIKLVTSVASVLTESAIVAKESTHSFTSDASSLTSVPVSTSSTTDSQLVVYGSQVYGAQVNNLRKRIFSHRSTNVIPVTKATAYFNNMDAQDIMGQTNPNPSNPDSSSSQQIYSH